MSSVGTNITQNGQDLKTQAFTTKKTCCTTVFFKLAKINHRVKESRINVLHTPHLTEEREHFL